LAEGAAISLFLFPLLVAVAIAFLRLARRAEVV
jgi:multiple sugar transport system permease protein